MRPPAHPFRRAALPALAVTFALLLLIAPVEAPASHALVPTGPAGSPEDRSTMDAATSGDIGVAEVTGPAPVEGPFQDLGEEEEVEAPEPVVPLFEVEGTLTAQTFHPDPATSGIQGTLTVNGFTFEVPVGVPVRIGDAPGEVMAFSDVSASPPGFSSLVGHATVIAAGVGTPLGTDAEGERLYRWSAHDVFLEEAENVLHGVFTRNDEAGLFLGGVPVVLETDPRFAPFNRVVDDIGQTLALEDIPPGVLGTAEGAFKDGKLHARIVEVGATLPPAEGEADVVRIDRGELRESRGELRVRGVSNNPDATLEIFEWLGDHAGTMPIASGVPIGADGAWRYRGSLPDGFTFTSSPPAIQVRSSGGGVATFDLTLR